MKKRWLFAAAAVLLILALIGCSQKQGSGGNAADTGGSSGSSGTSGSSGSSALEPVTLKVMLFGEKPSGMDEVLAEFERRTKDTLNTKLDIEWSPINDHKEKVRLKMTAGEEVDLVFDAPWANLRTLAQQGAYLELDSYFNNDEYPGLKKAFSNELLDANRINGKIYAVPFGQYFATADGIYIRKDLREKYGMDPIDSYEDLELFFQKVLENEGGMVPLAVEGRRGFYNLFAPVWSKDDPVITVGAGGHWFVVLSEDRKKVLNAVFMGDSQEQFDKLPAPYNDPATFFGRFEIYREWNKYLEKDSISQKDKVGLFASGKAAAVENDIAQYSNVLTKLKAGVPEAELEFFAYNACFREMTPECIGANYVANNSVAVPVTSKHPDRVMKFLDWIFQNQENHDLFEFGVPGVHWEPVGDNEYKLTSNHVFPGYELTHNPNYIRINAELDETSKKYLGYLADQNTYFRTPYAGFKFDTTPVKSEIAMVQPKYDEFVQIAANGLLDNFWQKAQEANKEWQSLGLETIRQEVIKQLQAYIDAGGN